MLVLLNQLILQFKFFLWYVYDAAESHYSASVVGQRPTASTELGRNIAASEVHSAMNIDSPTLVTANTFRPGQSLTIVTCTTGEVTSFKLQREEYRKPEYLPPLIKTPQKHYAPRFNSHQKT
jgi:hypothetical protein